MKREPDQAAPYNWIQLVNEKGDLDLAFKALEDWNHFHTDTIRGRIRSLQLRPKEGWEYFARAEARVDEFGRTLRNLLRRFYLRVYRFDNALMEESGPEGGDPALTEKCLKDLLRSETPDSEIASQLRACCHGMFLLNREDYPAARKIFRRLIWESRDRLGDEKTDFYFGAAVAHRALDEEAEADRQLDNGRLFIPALDNTFNQGHYAAKLGALLRLWDRREEALEWDDFVVRLKIPKKTCELFRERSDRILARSAALKRVFLF